MSIYPRPLCWVVLLFVCGLLWSCALAPPVKQTAAPPAETAPSTDLRSLFRRAYDDAIAYHRATTIHGGPLIVQDLLGMTLIKTDGERLRYEMDKTVYFTVAHNTHPPYGIYSIIAFQGYGPLNDYQLSRLAEYRVGIVASLARLDTYKIDADTRQRLAVILNASRDYIDQISAAGAASRESFQAFVTPLRPLFHANFHLAALEQLRQFRAQMKIYQARYAEENWDDLRVVVMGFHQTRNLWVLKQFFQWLVREPDYEHRVVYAEFQHPFFGENRARAESLAIELATKVDFDLSAAEIFLGDKTLLGSDILGPYGRDIIESWGPSDFFAE